MKFLNQLKIKMSSLSEMLTAEPTMKGFLHKSGQLTKNFKKRFFVLINDSLYYFQSDQTDSKTLGIIFLDKNTIIKRGDSQIQKKNIILIETHKQYILVADSDEITNLWIEALCSVVHKAD
jgi:hypothetical protein